MGVPDNLHFSEDHEWIDALTGVARVGITGFAAEALGDIVYVQLPEAGTPVTAGEPCGEVESTKSVSEIYAPASGNVTAVNEAVAADPSLVNADPYGDGWLYELQITQVATMMSPEDYARFVGGAG